MSRKQVFVDRYGATWVRVDDQKVYNRRSGYGLWDNGKGLKVV